MTDLIWLVISTGIATIIALAAFLPLWKMRKERKSGFSTHDERTSKRIQGFMAIGNTLVILGIIFGEDRSIGYSFIGAGMLLSVCIMIKSRRNERGSVEVR
jgi:hypothetical protein